MGNTETFEVCAICYQKSIKNYHTDHVTNEQVFDSVDQNRTVLDRVKSEVFISHITSHLCRKSTSLNAMNLFLFPNPVWKEKTRISTKTNVVMGDDDDYDDYDHYYKPKWLDIAFESTCYPCPFRPTSVPPAPQV